MKREMTIVPYDSEWNEQYREIQALLSEIFKDIVVDMQHFGSTAIEGTPAKPIIDDVKISLHKLSDNMRENGYSKVELWISQERTRLFTI